MAEGGARAPRTGDRARPGVAGLLTLLGLPEYAGLWWSAAVSTLGDQLAAVALTVVVYDRTQSAALSSATYAVTLLAPLLGAPLFAGLADSRSRRAVMVWCAWGQAALMGVIALPGMPVWLAVVALALAVMLSTPYLAAQEATLPLALPADRYELGVAAHGWITDIGQLIGLALSGVIVTLVGPSVSLAADAATFAAAAVLVQLTGRSRPAADPGLRRGARRTDDQRPAPSRSAALRLILDTPQLRALLGLRLLAGFALVPYGLAVPLANQLGARWAVGLLLAMEPAAVIVGGFVLYAAVPSVPARLRMIGPLAILTVAPLLAFAAGPHWATVLPLLLLTYLAGSYHTPARAQWAKIVPNRYRGRVHGIARPLLRLVQGVGIAIGGVVAQLVGSATLTIALAGTIGTLVALPAAVGWARARRADEARNDHQSLSATGLTSSTVPHVQAESLNRLDTETAPEHEESVSEQP